MSLLVIFMLLYNEFKDVKESGVILLNLPLALIGGVIIVWLTSGEISIPAIIGFISLFGIATRNGMLLISHYTHLRGEGMGLRDTRFPRPFEPDLDDGVEFRLGVDPVGVEWRSSRE